VAAQVCIAEKRGPNVKNVIFIGGIHGVGKKIGDIESYKSPNDSRACPQTAPSKTDLTLPEGSNGRDTSMTA